MARTERIHFDGARGDRLDARLELPAGPPRAYAIFAHCFTCSKAYFAASRISRQLADRGFAVLRFDFTGLGESEGEFADTTFSSNVGDLEKAAEFLGEHYAAPALLIGHSLGGAAAIVAAGRIPSVKAVATLGAPADAEHVIRSLKLDTDAVEADGRAEARLGDRQITITRDFLDDIAGQNVEAAAGNLDMPLLIAHSPVDRVVGIDNASRLFAAARHPKSFISLDHADHLINDSRDAAYIAGVIAAWASRYVAGDGARDVPEPADRGGVVVAETGQGRYENHVVIGDHVMMADEPEDVGGGDAGPSPYQYLEAALGACTSMTLRMYAERKDWPLERVSVTLHHEKGHAEDGEAAAGGEDRKVDIIERTIRIDGDLDADQRARLMEIADKCPVHRSLNSPVVIRTQPDGDPGVD
jgi:uncharacterized OsmC-like protein/pimeloyl-ACP methyl ester carboxylesterase